MLPKCTWLNLSVLFAKDVVGTGRTMKALLSSIEKYKPNMVKVARYVRYTSSLFLSFQTSPRGMLTQDAVFFLGADGTVVFVPFPPHSH